MPLSVTELRRYIQFQIKHTALFAYQTGNRLCFFSEQKAEEYKEWQQLLKVVACLQQQSYNECRVYIQQCVTDKTLGMVMAKQSEVYNTIREAPEALAYSTDARERARVQVEEGKAIESLKQFSRIILHNKRGGNVAV